MSEPLAMNDDLLTHIGNYVSTEAKYMEANTIEKLVKVLSPVYFFCVCIVCVLISLLSILFGIAWWIGDKVNNYVLGFVFIAVLIVTTISFFTIFQHSFLKRVRNQLLLLIYH